eukprot:symbB.v1.2.001235.t1/scaffold63.1/size477159/6
MGCGGSTAKQYCGAVGAFFDDNGNAEGALSQFEEEVRAAGDNNVIYQTSAHAAHAAITSIAHRWNLICDFLPKAN